MEKLIMCIIMFAVLAFSTTGILIYNTNQNILNENIKDESGDLSGDLIYVPQISKEKTLDLNAKYNENDLEFTYDYIDCKELNAEVSVLKIKGLKNKEIENKLNTEIRNEIEKLLLEIIEEDNIDLSKEKFYFYYGEYANFSNVFSFNCYASYRNRQGEYVNDRLTFTYELVNGKKLEFEDLFVADTDIQSIIRRILYKNIASNLVHTYESFNLHFDKDLGLWMCSQYEYDEITGVSYEKEVEYIPPMTEEDVSNYIQKFMANIDRKFYFTPTRLYVSTGISNYMSYIDFTEIADKLVIYDKYLTDESIYERDDIGNENLWTCTKSIDSNYIVDRRGYQEYGFGTDNFFYDFKLYNNLSNSYPYKEAYNIIYNNIKIESLQVIEEYKEKANNDKDNFYILSYEPQIDYYQTFSDKEVYNNLIKVSITPFLETIPKTEITKEKLEDDLKAAYRYYNNGFYGGGVRYFFEQCNFTWNREYRYPESIRTYDAKSVEGTTVKEITSIEEIFNEGVDYETLIKDMMKKELKETYQYRNATNDEIEEIMSKIEYSLYWNGIEGRLPKEYLTYALSITFNEFDNSLFNKDKLEFIEIEG